jgi:hypothetical protein
MAKYTIEFDGPNNENYRFAPSATTLRGAWRSHRVAHNDMNDAMKSMSTVPYIPGMRVTLNTDERSATVLDPLATTDEGKQIWEKVLAKIKQHEAFFGAKQRLLPPITKANLTDSEMKTWAYYMAMAVESGYAVVLSDSQQLPSVEQIRSLPGGIRIGLLGSNSGYKPESEKWRDVVEPAAMSKTTDGKGALAAAK